MVELPKINDTNKENYFSGSLRLRGYYFYKWNKTKNIEYLYLFLDTPKDTYLNFEYRNWHY